jgi:hypothetical protein
MISIRMALSTVIRHLTTTQIQIAQVIAVAIIMYKIKIIHQIRIKTSIATQQNLELRLKYVYKNI